jgi:mannitol 2-dehydrogenase
MRNKISSDKDFNVLNKYLETYKSKTSEFFNNDDSVLADSNTNTNYILHIGVGGFHRSHQAYAIQEINRLYSSEEWKIIGIGLRDSESILSDFLRKQYFQYTLVSRCNQKSIMEIINVIQDYIVIPNLSEKSHFTKLLPPQSNVKIITMTVTEKGYTLDTNNNLDENHILVKDDLENWKVSNGINKPKTVVGFLCSFLYIRMIKNFPPITVMSCDNLCGNGNLTKKICLQFSKKVNEDLYCYISENISFPNSMVDRITPITTKTDRFALQLNYNIIDSVPVVCENYMSWVIENNFSSPRPKFELFHPISINSDIHPYESQKLVLLNSSHSFIAYVGLYFSKAYVYEYMMDDYMVHILSKYMDIVKITLPKTKDLNHEEYKKIVLQRFKNYFIKDELTRLAQDGTQKLKVCLEIPLNYYYEHEPNTIPKYLCVLLALLLLYLRDSKDPSCDPLQKQIKKEIEVDLDLPAVQRALQLFLPTSLHGWEPLFEGVKKYMNDIFYKIVLQEILTY